MNIKNINNKRIKIFLSYAENFDFFMIKALNIKSIDITVKNTNENTINFNIQFQKLKIILL